MRALVYILTLGLGLLLFSNCNKEDDSNTDIECEELEYFIGCWEGNEKISIFKATGNDVIGQYGENLDGNLYDLVLNALTCEISGKWQNEDSSKTGSFKLIWDEAQLNVNWSIPSENRSEAWIVEKTSENPCI